MKSYISNLVNGVPPSATFAIAILAQKLKNEGKDIVNLSIGEPDFITPDYIKKAAHDAIDSNKYFTYPPAAGYSELRKAISAKLNKENNIKCESNQIVITPGSKQALSVAMMTIINPGDEVIIFTPFWVSYEATVLISRGKPIFISGSKSTDYKVTGKQLENAISQKTKAIIYSSPCNPTGSIFSEKEIRDIAKVLEKYPNIFAISDEIYEHINYGKTKHFSLGSIDSIADRVITSNGFSKAWAMTGWRLGYMCASTEIAAAATKLLGQFASGTCGIVQKAGLEALNGGMEKINYMIQQYHKRRDFVVKRLKKIKNIDLCIPDGAFYVFPEVKNYYGKKYKNKTITNSKELCRFLLNEMGVALVPGAGFGCDDCIRLSFAASIDTISEGIDRIEHGLRVLK